MELRLELPPAFAVKSVDYDDKARVLTIVPRFFAATAPICTLKVIGANGAERVLTMTISGNTGDPKLIASAKEIEETAFDKMKKGAK